MLSVLENLSEKPSDTVGIKVLEPNLNLNPEFAQIIQGLLIKNKMYCRIVFVTY